MTLDPKTCTVSYQANLQNHYPTLNLNSSFENEEPGVPAVRFATASSANERHVSTGSSDTQSSNNAFIMSSGAQESSPLRETQRDPFSIPRIVRYMEGLHFIIIVMVTFSVSITVALIVQIYTIPPQVVPHGGIASSSAFCSDFVFQSFKETEASTVDSAVLAALCICITHPHAAGIGGGGFAVVHDQTKVISATQFYDFRESSPAMFSNETFRNESFEGKSIYEVDGSLAVAVPGVLKGLQKLHNDYGKLSWKAIVEKAASIARNGFPVSEDLAQAIQNANFSTFSADLQLLLNSKNGSRLAAGDQLKLPELANLLENLAANGANSFYAGNLSQKFIAGVSAFGGIMTESDLKQYEARVSHDVNETKFSDVKLISAGPPSAGFALYAVMSAMALYPQHPVEDLEKFRQVHRMIEAIKISEAQRTELGDPFRPNYTAPEFYTNKNLGLTIKQKINDSAALPLKDYLNLYQPLQLTGSGQQYVSLIGPDGHAVQITLSIGSHFGSGQMASGIILNDAMRDFSWTGRSSNFSQFSPSKANYLTGNARPMSSLLPVFAIPAVTKCGEYVLPGSIPGDESLSVITQVLIYNRNRNLEAAIRKPRFHYQIASDELDLENGIDSKLEQYLRSSNHDLRSKSIGVFRAVQWYDNVVRAFGDIRSPVNASFSF